MLAASAFIVFHLVAAVVPDENAAGHDDLQIVLVSDAECSADSSETCAMSARQLRANLFDRSISTPTPSSETTPTTDEETPMSTGERGQMANVSADDYYWDDLCRPCPVSIYRHCDRGGKILGSRSCGTASAYCEAKCSGKPHLAPLTSAGVRTLYHTTSPKIAEEILASGFRPGSHGWCGGGIYFFGLPKLPETKLGDDSHLGAVLEVEVDLGLMAHLNSRCNGALFAKRHYDSVTFNPFDGDEFVIYSKHRVISVKRYS